MNEFFSTYNDSNQYDWKEIEKKIQNNNIIMVTYSGVNKKDKTDYIYVKSININSKNQTSNYYKQIIKQTFFIISLKNKNCFPKNIIVMLSKNEEYLYLIYKGNNIPLNYLINAKNVNYLNNNDLIKWIIYQITFGLFVLHSNNIIHHDIKASNILINEEGNIFISGFETAIFKFEESISFSLPYSSPELLINLKVDEKTDMWNLGIIILELFCKTSKILYNKDINDKDNQIKYILSKFGITENYSNEDLKDLLNNNKNIELKIEKKILDNIGDKDAINLINNLIVFNPNKRYSAKEVLESEYLKEFKDSLDIEPIEYPINYNEISKGVIDHRKFIELIKKLIDKNK